MSDETASIRHWNTLHAQPRFRPRYPHEHVVRFLMANFPEAERSARKVLDIGVGGGRHTKLLCELGFQTFGIDISDEGVRQCEAWLRTLNYQATLKHANMAQLPFADETFDAALACGVYYYADCATMRQAIAELHRVLRPQGRACVLMKTTADYRFAKGTCLENNTFRLTIHETNEYGAVLHFLAEADVPQEFAPFSQVQFEKTETTFDQRHAVNSEWLITVQK